MNHQQPVRRNSARATILTSLIPCNDKGIGCVGSRIVIAVDAIADAILHAILYSIRNPRHWFDARLLRCGVTGLTLTDLAD